MTGATTLGEVRDRLAGRRLRLCRSAGVWTARVSRAGRAVCSARSTRGPARAVALALEKLEGHHD